jgi:chromosomal replication initiation ATPase DnaA
VTQRPRNTPEAAQYPLPLVEPDQLDLFGFATAQAMGGQKTNSLAQDKQADGLRARSIDPVLEMFSDPWSAAHFIDGSAYGEAKKVLSNWRSWLRPAMALVGPHGAGKTHLARIWCRDLGGQFATAASLAEASPERVAAMASGPLVVDAADTGQAPLQLFSIFNTAYAGGGPVVFTGVNPPATWPSTSSDLLSRFSSLTSVRIHEPDDALLAKILQIICRKRFIRLEDTVAWGLINRSVQSFEALHSLSEGIERLVQFDKLEPSARVLERILAYARMSEDPLRDREKD